MDVSQVSQCRRVTVNSPSQTGHLLNAVFIAFSPRGSRSLPGLSGDRTLEIVISYLSHFQEQNYNINLIDIIFGNF
jgi:hypothetical protein